MKSSELAVRFCMTLTLLCGCSWGQAAPANNRPADTAAAMTKRESPKAKLTPEQERGLRLLKAAEAEAAGLAPDVHAFVLWRASYAYTKVDPKKAEKVAADAFTATQALEDPANDDRCGPIGSVGDIKSWIQQRILSAMVDKRKITETGELLAQTTEPVRNGITTQLVNYYVKEKDFAHSEALLSQLADSKDYPFSAAADLVLAMGPELSANRMTIFNQALDNFEQHSDKKVIGEDDIGNFIERTWTKVPSAIVLEAVNKILEQAKSDDSRSHFSLTTGKGGVVLNSTYEYRLFQLLPVLQELDKGKAEELLRDNAETKAKLAKYPQGMQSLIPPGQTHSYYSSGITDGDSPQAAERAAKDQAQIQQRMDQVVAESQEDPTQALTDALGLPIQGEHGSPRAEVLLRIAEGAVKKRPSVSKSALDELIKIQDQMTPAEVVGLANVPTIYLDLGDEDGAKKAV